ncbi:MAG: QueT transporter family protein [Acutalibacteraceae bacterium]
MNTFKKTHQLAVASLIAAFYVALVFLQETLVPTSASAAVQFRVAEALCVLCLFSPTAIAGVTVGCFFSNFLFMGALPLDMVFGTAASLFAALCMYLLRNVKVKDVPVLSLLMPAVFNGVIIGAEIEAFFIEGDFNFFSFLIQGGLVAVGELAVLFTLGLGLYKLIKSKNLVKYIS